MEQEVPNTEPFDEGDSETIPAPFTTPRGTPERVAETYWLLHNK